MPGEILFNFFIALEFIGSGLPVISISNSEGENSVDLEGFEQEFTTGDWGDKEGERNLTALSIFCALEVELLLLLLLLMLQE
jgi:hypothetical protein